MNQDNLWVICKHIMEGKADEAWLRPDKMAVCPSCAMIPPENDELFVVCECRVREKLGKIENVLGRQYLAPCQVH